MGKYLSYLNFGFLTQFSLGPGLLFGILVVVFLFLFGLSIGKTKAVISLLGIYIAYVLQAIFPYFSESHKAIRFSPEMYMTRIAIFFIFYIATFFVLSRSLIKYRTTMKEFSILWVSLISFLQLGILISIILNFIPVDKITMFPSSLVGYFAEQQALFFWMTAPILILIFMRRDKRSKTEE